MKTNHCLGSCGVCWPKVTLFYFRPPLSHNTWRYKCTYITITMSRTKITTATYQHPSSPPVWTFNKKNLQHPRLPKKHEYPPGNLHIPLIRHIFFDDVPNFPRWDTVKRFTFFCCFYIVPFLFDPRFCSKPVALGKPCETPVVETVGNVEVGSLGLGN